MLVNYYYSLERGVNILSRDQVIGVLLVIVGIIGIIIYGWLVFFPPYSKWDLIVLKLTGFVAVGGVLGILAWIGYTLATTPPPKPIEEIEKELEEELKKLEEEVKEEKTTEEGGKKESKEEGK